MTQDKVLRMAIDAGATDCANPDKWGILEISYENLERFAALVAAHTLSNIDPSKLMSFQEGFEAGRVAEREKVARWMMERGYATGHGDTIQELIKEVEWQAKEKEREACAKIANSWQTDVLNPQYHCDCATAIRRRGEK